jgi:hypothetical protein
MAEAECATRHAAARHRFSVSIVTLVAGRPQPIDPGRRGGIAALEVEAVGEP